MNFKDKNQLRNQGEDAWDSTAFGEKVRVMLQDAVGVGRAELLGDQEGVGDTVRVPLAVRTAEPDTVAVWETVCVEEQVTGSRQRWRLSRTQTSQTEISTRYSRRKAPDKILHLKTDFKSGYPLGGG